jgi:TolB-like protein
VVPKALETLQVLLERRGQLVEKAELMRLVWPDTTVEEVGLARNISLLRKVLGDEAETGAYIETIPRRGYRFVAEASETGPATFESARFAARRFRRWLVMSVSMALLGVIYWQFYRPSHFLSQARGTASLAVIPFECPAADPDQAAFCEGLSDLIVSALSKAPGIQLLSPGTVRRYRRFMVPAPLMARLVGLDVLVEGAVQKAGDRIRIAARLVDVHTGRLLWAESYDYPARDLHGAQPEAARAIAARVEARLAWSRPR